MIYLHLVLEDTYLRASRNNTHWYVNIKDEISSDQINIEMTDEEFASVMCVAIGDHDVKNISETALRIFEKIPQNLRVIP